MPATQGSDGAGDWWGMKELLISLTLLGHFGIPLALCLWLALYRFKTWLSWTAVFVVTATQVLGLYFIGMWAWFGLHFQA